MNINQEFEQIEEKNKGLIEEAINMMKQVPDPKHSLSHMESVVAYTKEILLRTEKADKEVCIISAYWHDVGRTGKKNQKLWKDALFVMRIKLILWELEGGNNA